MSCDLVLFGLAWHGNCEAAGLRKLLHSLLDGREEAWHATMMGWLVLVFVGVGYFLCVLILAFFDFDLVSIDMEAVEVVIVVVVSMSQIIISVCVLCYRCDSRSTADGFLVEQNIICVCVWVGGWVSISTFLWRQCAFWFFFLFIFDWFWYIWFNFGLFVWRFSLIQETFDVESRGGGAFFWFRTPFVCVCVCDRRSEFVISRDREVVVAIDKIIEHEPNEGGR